MIKRENQSEFCIDFISLNYDDENDVPVLGIEAAKENWSIFYPELERLIDQFIAPAKT